MKSTMGRTIYLIVSLFVILNFTSCQERAVKNLSPGEVAIAWAELTIEITKNTPANSPTYTSRAMGYIGLTMYESVVHSDPGHQSLNGQLNGLKHMPVPNSGQSYDWVISLNTAQATIIKRIYNQTADSNKLKIDSLEAIIFKQYATQHDTETSQRSSDYGRSVAETIFEWSKTDGGHRGYLKNFDKTMTHPDQPGSWVPPLYAQSVFHFPLHPHWGENRTFAKTNTDLPLPDFIPYDSSINSPYYQQFMQVYQMDKRLTQEDKEIAIWWGDDPSDTFTPPGHSYYLATQVLKQKNPELIICAKTYASVGMAVADAFINCWKWKYHFFTERPNTFIPRFIDAEWKSFWPDPPFPAFPSGHAIQAAAAATALEHLYGENCTFTDSAHIGRARDEIRNVDFSKPRKFTKFWQVAEETANSRFYGGIHTPQDNETGLQQGKKIAGNIMALPWEKEE